MKVLKKYKINFDKISKYLFVISLCLLMYGYGFITCKNQLYPYYKLNYAYHQIKNLITFSVPHHLFPIRYEESGVNILDSNKIMPGVTLITSYWPIGTKWTPGIRLIDSDGKILHHWDLKANEIWPKSPHNDFSKNKRNINEDYIHGTYLYPNGDIICNIEYLGLIRMNSTGEVLWKLPYRTHHSIFHDEEGNLWVPGAKWIESGSDREKHFPGLRVPFTEETIIKVSPDGIILHEISLLESLYESNYQHLLYHYNRLSGDIFHLNDVEVLSSKLAENFPSFENGDIVFSSRHLSLIGVIDQNGRIKWVCTGVFTEQHDPDFETNGWITIFDNRTNLGKTKIRTINPSSNEVKTLYPTNLDQTFYTEAGGKHQKLNNGNRLITEARAGRVFEISPEGETVWEWIQQSFDKKYVPEVLEGTRYNFNEQDIAKWEKADKN